jgi:excisionase family DNA binding protein
VTRSQLVSELREIKEALKVQAPRPMTLSEAAVYLSVSRSYLYKLTSQNRIPYFKTAGGKRCMFKRENLNEWLLAHRVSTREELAAQVVER